MKSKDLKARVLGGTAGAVVAFAAPHIGCVGAFTAAAISAGADAQAAQYIAIAGGVSALAIAGGAIYYGVRTECSLCRIFGETTALRASKAVAMVAAGFVAMSTFNTATGRGIVPDEKTIISLQFARDTGQSVWSAFSAICIGAPK